MADTQEIDAYTVEEFAHRHRISRRNAYDENLAGRLIFKKVGSRTIVTKEDAEAWRRSLPALATPDAP